MKHLTATLALSLLALPTLALAKEPPADLTPTADAAVTYAVQASGQPNGTMAIAWDAESGKVRIDSTLFPGWLLLERQQNRAFMVMDEQRAYLPLPAEAASRASPRLPPGVELTEGGTDTVAGQTCTVWKFNSPQQGEGSLCVTDARVMLRTEARSSAGQQVKIEAQTVSMSAQEAGRFTLPTGYTEATPPNARPAPAR
jgi:hypothetical protein